MLRSRLSFGAIVAALRHPLCVLAVLTATSSFPAAAAVVAYATTITLKDLADDSLADTLNASSRLVALEAKPPPTDAALRRRAEEDLPRLQGVMAAAGYWQATVEDTVTPGPRRTDVTVTIVPGPLFHLAQVAFHDPSGAPAPLLDTLGPAGLGLTLGDPARSAPVADADARILDAYGRAGFPFAKVSDRRVTVDVADHTMSVAYTVDPGPAARFGPVTVTGLVATERGFVDRRIRWQEGKPYDVSEVEATRQDLVASGLFSSVHVAGTDHVDGDGTLAMTVAVAEAPFHTVGAGVGYNTNFGLGGRATWEDRNLFGSGDDLKLWAGAAQRQLGLAASFREPDIGLTGQDLLTTTELLRETTDAYDSRRLRVYVGLDERQFLPVTFGGGLLLDRAYLTTDEPGRDEHYLLLGVPLYARRDTTTNLLDPISGTRLQLTVTPYHGLSDSTLNFVSARLEGSLYQPLFNSARTILAGRAAVGSIVGADLSAVPLDLRFVAGGAGSVRGYGYQLAGPLDGYYKPVGGRSLVDLGLEFRYRFTDSFGIVPFVEGANVYPTTLPDRTRLFYAGGIGLRYYTSIGPVRIDLAVPFDKRQTDSPVQFYISLGQAF